MSLRHFLHRKKLNSKNEYTTYTKTRCEICELCAHFSVDAWYYIHRKNPPIHYIVFATPHKKKYLLQKRQLIPLSFLLSKNTAKTAGSVLICFTAIWIHDIIIYTGVYAGEKLRFTINKL